MKKYDELEQFILTYKNHIKSPKDENERKIDKLNQLKKCTVKFDPYKIWNFLKIELKKWDRRFVWNLKQVDQR